MAIGDFQSYVKQSLAEIINNSNRLAKYQVARIDNASDPSYFGFLDKDENFYIQKIDEAGQTITYSKPVKGVSTMNTLWTNRATTTYFEYSQADIN